MGNNTKKKVRSLPPLGKETRSRSKKKNEVLRNHVVQSSKIETVMANLTQIVPTQNINAHMQTKN